MPDGIELATCFTSDFFIEEADEWRKEVWDIIRSRPEVEFLIPTKRIARFEKCKPKDWGEGWDNVFICVSVENNRTAKERISYLLNAPIKKRGIFLAPVLEDTDIEEYLQSGKILLVSVAGESCSAARVCDFRWVEKIKELCDKYGVVFQFHQTGSNFLYRGKYYKIPHCKEYEQAQRAFTERTKKTTD